MCRRLLLAFFIVAPPLFSADGPAADLQSLSLLKADAYPRAFFFRSSEGAAANPRSSYEQWDATFSRLMGIEGKALDEELPGRSAKNIQFFTRFKREHPDQLVLLHYNGNARDPREPHASRFYAGHWLYYLGSSITTDLPAAEGEADVKVAEPGRFLTNIGRYKDANEDVALCALDDSGRPDWSRCEQVQLVSVDAKAKTIRVRRGAYGSKPLAFTPGHGYAASHAGEGPWGRNSHLLWAYNYSLDCPKDAAGRTAADVLSDDLAEHFATDLSAFDGLEFDVLHDHAQGQNGKRRPIDLKGNGQASGEAAVGAGDPYQAGVIRFLQVLRQKMGPSRLIMADGWSIGNQRGFGILNGIESEGWPSLQDVHVDDWSGGLNRQSFWLANSAEPRFCYVNHKFNAGPAGPARPGPGGAKKGKKGKADNTPAADREILRAGDIPWNIHRLVMAGAMFTNSAVCYSMTPPAEPGESAGVWDELRCGVEHRIGWLGAPAGEAVHLAARAPDLVAGPLGRHVTAAGAAVTEHDGGVTITPHDPAATEVRFRVALANGTPDVFVTLTATADPMRNAPPQVARILRVNLAGAPVDAKSDFAWVNGAEFTSTWYFPDAPPNATIEFSVEGGETVTVRRLTAHAAPELVYRKFEHGLVIANPTPREQTFDLAGLLPGVHFRRLKGSAHQDPKTNDGAVVGESVTMGGKDALFLVKD